MADTPPPYPVSYGNYNQQATSFGVGQTFGWVYVRMPDGSVQNVPPTSPEAQKYAHITPTMGQQGQFQGQNGWSDGLGANGQPAAAPASPTGQPLGTGTDINAQIQDFYKRMMAPLNQDDPEVKQAIANGVNATQKYTGMNGIRGGISQAGLVKSALNSQNQLSMQRQQMGLSAMQLGSNRDLGLGVEGGLNSRFGQDMAQSNAINAQAGLRANLQAGVAAGGQAVQGLTALTKGSGQPSAVPDNIGGSGSYNTQTGTYGSDPGEWGSPF